MIVLDTHAWVRWASHPDRLPEPAREAIRQSLDAGEPVRISTISTWEVAMLIDRGRLDLAIPLDEWIALAEAAPEIAFVPLSNSIAVRAVGLEDFPHRDPADRMILATALELDATLVTADDRVRAYAPTATIWD